MVFPVFFDSVLESLINSTTSVVKTPSDACLFAHSGFIFLYDVILLCSCRYFSIVSLILLCCLPLLLLPQLSCREKIFFFFPSNDAQMLNGDFGRTSTGRRNEWIRVFPVFHSCGSIFMSQTSWLCCAVIIVLMLDCSNLQLSAEKASPSTSPHAKRGSSQVLLKTEPTGTEREFNTSESKMRVSEGHNPW